MLTSDRLTTAALKAKQKSIDARNNLILSIRYKVEDILISHLESNISVPFNATGLIFKFSALNANTNGIVVGITVVMKIVAPKSDNSDENSSDVLASYAIPIDLTHMDLRVVNSNRGVVETSTVDPISLTEIFDGEEMYIDLSGDEQL